ncbi:hypothetical protein AAC387_Pa02g3401 [Persea americana]
MEIQEEKVYVAVGKDVQEGMGTLKWALKNWSSQPISIVIVHVKTSSNDFVDTPYGKLPASSISDEGLKVLRMYGKDKSDKLLSKYKAFCGKVRTEVMKIEKSEEPVHNVIVELISRLHVTKLVMGITCMKSSSRKAKSGISGSFYVHKHKPDFCELSIICGGRLVSLRDASSEGCIDAEEFTVDDMRKKMKEKGSLRGWIERILPNYGTSSVVSNSPRGSPHGQLREDSEKWENCVEEIENYLQWLSLNSPAKDIEEEDGTLELSPMEQQEREDRDSKMTTPQKIEALKANIEDAKKMALEKRNEAKVGIERCRKAAWVISVCDRRARELKGHEDEEKDRQIDLKMELDIVRKQQEEAFDDILENEKRLKSALELEGELKDIIQANLSERLRIEAQLDNAAITREEILREINEMCKQRDVFRRRSVFCRERRAVIMSNGLGYNYREFTEDELRKATDNFSDHMQIKFGPKGVIYKGRLNHTMIAIKMQDEWRRKSQEEFQAKVNLLRQIRHPHILTVLGACSNARSVVYEYAHNRSLQDILFSTKNRSKRSSSSTKNPRSRRKRPSLLPWQDRVRIAAEICSAVAFLHATTPWPTPHGRIRPSNVLIDRNLAAKIVDFGADEGGGDVGEEMRKDVCDLGVLMLQMVTGREDVEVERRGGVLVGEADERAGEWPVEVAVRFGVVGARCVQVGGVAMGMEEVLREMEEVRRMAVAWRQHWCDGYGRDRDRDDEMDGSDVPSVFVCPILQELMKQPYIAADGFSYEREAIEAWVRSGHDTSPMTNLKLQHTRLTPNHTLRSLIEDWHYNRS